MIRHAATPEAPWYVVPADNKWFTRVVVAGAIIQTSDSLLADKGDAVKTAMTGTQIFVGRNRVRKRVQAQ